MYAIDEGLKRINDEIVTTYEREVAELETKLSVEAGTTGYKGTPDRRAGGRTYLRVKCENGDFHFEPVTDAAGTVVGIEIAACGDAGLNAVMKALSFAEQVINDQRCDVDD